jgi:hypothetical protein
MADQKSDIVGKWEAVDENNMTAYIFEENGICQKEIGFFEYTDPQKAIVSDLRIFEDDNSSYIHAVLNNIIRYYRYVGTFR